MIRFVINIYSLLVIVHVVFALLNVPANRWTEMLRSVVEPALQVTRNLMKRFLPFLNGLGVDLSPVVLVVVLQLVSCLLTLIV